MSECRICYEDSTNEALINPCACAGSQKWIHESCLQRWRRMNNNNIDRCELCLNNYIIIRYNQEVYFIKIEHFHYSVLEMLASLMLTFIAGNALWFVDTYNQFYSVDLLGLSHLKTKEMLMGNMWFVWTYYQGLCATIINFLYLIIFNIWVGFKINNKMDYYLKRIPYNVSLCFYYCNFFILCGFANLFNDISVIEFWSPLLTSFMFTFMAKHIIDHNQVLQNINNLLPEERIHAFEVLTNSTDETKSDDSSINIPNQIRNIEQLNPLNGFIPLESNDSQEEKTDSTTSTNESNIEPMEVSIED